MYRWIQKPVCNHRTQDQRVLASLKSKENQSKEKTIARHGIFNLTSTQIIWAKKGSRHMKKMNLFTIYLQTRLGYWKPHAVHSVTVFCDFKPVLMPSPDVSHLIPVPITSDPSTAHSRTEWLPDATWEPVPGGLADHTDFLLYMSLAENTAGSWFKLPVFSELGLNNAGRTAAREYRKLDGRYSVNPFMHCLAQPSDWTSVCRWRRKPHKQYAELIKKQPKKQARSEPASKFASIRSPACCTTQLWTPLGSGDAPRGLPASPAPSSASSVVSSSSYASIISDASADSLPARAPLGPFDFNAAAASPAARTRTPRPQII